MRFFVKAVAREYLRKIFICNTQASLNNANAVSWLSSLKSENESKFVNKSQSSTWCST